MPRLSSWFIRLAFVYFVLGFTVGGLMLAQKGGIIHPAVWTFRLAHQEFLLVGFMLQLVFGVGFWILPRAARPQRGEWLMQSALVLINTGVWFTAAGGVIPSLSALVPVGRLSEAGAVALFVMNIWPRVRTFREAQKVPDRTS